MLYFVYNIILRVLMKKYDYSIIEQTYEFDAHIQELNTEKLLTDIVIDKDYNYRLGGITWQILSVLLKGFASIVMPVYLMFKHGLIIKGRRNLRGLKTGAVSIANHVLNVDSAMVFRALSPKTVLFHGQEDSFRIPFIRHVVKLLGGMPIPKSIVAKQNYMKATDEFIAEGKIIQIFPEASEWPYYTKIRPFKTGAFHFAVRNNVPIIPICINFRQPVGLEKFLPNRDNLVTLHIGKLLYPNQDLPAKEAVEELKNRSHYNLTRMNKYFKAINTQAQIQEEADEEEYI